MSLQRRYAAHKLHVGDAGSKSNEKRVMVVVTEKKKAAETCGLTVVCQTEERKVSWED